MIVSFERIEIGRFKYIPQFMNLLIKTLKADIYDHLNMIHLHAKEPALLDASWVLWYRKPEQIDLAHVVDLILDNLQWRRVGKHTYKVEINPRAKLPGSYNSLQQVARWIEYGDQGLTRPMIFISRAMSRIKLKIPRYWRAFVQAKEGVLRIHECIYVR